MSLSNEKKKYYRSLGHNLNPVVTVAGNGLSTNVINEINRALDDHELIKVKMAVDDRDIRTEVVKKICSVTQAMNVQQIGKIVLLLREARHPNPKLSNLHKL
jgi:RNA-binding protein